MRMALFIGWLNYIQWKAGTFDKDKNLICEVTCHKQAFVPEISSRVMILLRKYVTSLAELEYLAGLRQVIHHY